MLLKRGSSPMDEAYWGHSVFTSSRAERSKAAVKIDRRKREGLRGKKSSQRQARQLAAQDLGIGGECGLPMKDELQLFINMMGPQVDMLWPVQDFVPSAVWANLNSDTVETSQLLLPHDMSFNPTPLINGVDESGSQHSPPSGLGIYDQRGHPVRSGSVGNSGTFLAGQEPTILSGPPAYVSLYSQPQSTDPRTNWRHQSTNANIAYWQPSTASPFASSHSGAHWDQESDASTLIMEYNQSLHYTLGINALPQTDVGLCHGLPSGLPDMSGMKALPEEDDLEYFGSPPFPNALYDSSSGSFSSTGASDMLEAMALRDSSESIHSPWSASKEHLGNKTLPCIRPASPHHADSWTWSSTSSSAPMFQSCACDSDLPHSSSSESIRTSFLADSSSSSHPMDIGAENHRPSKGRKILPDRPRLLAAPVLKSNDKPITTHSNKARRSTKSSVESMSPSVRKTAKLAAKPRNTPILPALSPVPRAVISSPRRLDEDEEMTEAELADRKAKDEFLIASRQKGLTYKQIRMEGGYTEAESTLRGRYRALTKSKEERVRKPEWSEMDLILLERGVRELSPPTSSRDSSGSEGPLSSKVPWKKVAEYIVQSGGTYLFGNSTCRKRWDELVREQTTLGKDPRLPFFEQNTGAMRAAFEERMRGQEAGYRYGRH